MMFILYFRLILGILCILASTVFFIIEVMGVFKMRYVLNRMHSAAIGDALALGLAFVGLMILNGLNFTTFKLFLVPLFMFCSSPVSSHLIASLEVTVSKGKAQYEECNVRDLDKLKEDN